MAIYAHNFIVQRKNINFLSATKKKNLTKKTEENIKLKITHVR